MEVESVGGYFFGTSGRPRTSEVNNTSPMASPAIMRRTNDLTNNLNNRILDPVLREQQFQQQILQLKQQQHLQQQFLLQQFQQQRQQLAEQHEKQLQQHIKYLEQQKKLEEEARLDKERRDKEKLESLKKKEKHEQSAVASSEVKLRLQEFVLNKKQREAAASSVNASPSSLSSWILGKYDDDFPPLRKTASEPNLKVRSIIKQKVFEKRCSPLLRRKDKVPMALRRRLPLTIETANSTPDSGSPPNGTASLTSQSSCGSTPIQEEQCGSPYGVLAGQGSVTDLTLYSSPSLPNISLGRPPVPSGSAESGKMGNSGEETLRAAAAARLGVPLTGHMLHSGIAYYPGIPIMDGEFAPTTSPAYIQQQMKALEQARSGQVSGPYPITDAQVAQARLHRIGARSMHGCPRHDLEEGALESEFVVFRYSCECMTHLPALTLADEYCRTGHRPLGRTRSAPLPLGHPILQPQQGMILPQQPHERHLHERQIYEQQQHNLLKQHIRQTVLTRAGSKNHVENVEEETEAAVAQEMKEDRFPEVIDLTEKKEEDSELVKQQREREAFLQQQRDLMMRHGGHTLTISEGTEGSAFTPCQHPARPLSRALSSPLVTLGPTGSHQESPVATKHTTVTTGLVFDSLMYKHQCVCGDNSSHPEHSGRLQSIWARLQETGLVARCERVRSRKATLEEIQSCHSEAHTLLFGTNPGNRQKLDMSKLAELPIKSFVMLPCGGIGVDLDTTWNELHTSSAARMAAGCVLELAFKVATREVKNGFAVVRPPGHHAEHQQAMGFCFFNSIAIAARQLRQRLKLEKILIVDWDVHHGNGTQLLFYDDPHVLYISLHRHDEGNFFPGTGGPEEVGVDDGIGFNVNIAWSGALNPAMGDAEYLAAFRTIVMPVAKDFDPDIVLVSSGFDGAAGHPAPLGGYKLSAACFGHMARQLMQLANGCVVLALEGGYDLPAICDASQECVRALLGDELAPLKEEEMMRKPCQPALETLQRTIAIQAPHWPCIKRWAHTIGYSYLEAQQREREEVDTVTALASLSMAHQASRTSVDCNAYPSSVLPVQQPSPLGPSTSPPRVPTSETRLEDEALEADEPMDQDPDCK